MLAYAQRRRHAENRLAVHGKTVGNRASGHGSAPHSSKHLTNDRVSNDDVGRGFGKCTQDTDTFNESNVMRMVLYTLSSRPALLLAQIFAWLHRHSHTGCMRANHVVQHRWQHGRMHHST